jgi:pyrroline-5-carboxylate reductase
MNHKTVGFIGGGRITRIILGGWRRAGVLPGKIVVSDCNSGILGELKSGFPSIEAVTCNNTAAAGQDIVLLAVHPPLMAEATVGLEESLRPDTIVVSLAPKITLQKLTPLLGGFERVVRVIPNAPSLINCGFNPVAFGPALTAEDRAQIKLLLSPLGESPEVPEEDLEAYAVITAMGPTYFWFQLQALREVALGLGLPGDRIAPALESMVSGAVKTLLASGLPPQEVMNLIPVKPLAEMEPQLREMYLTRLPAIHNKIKP